MASTEQAARIALATPAPTSSRPRWLHWLAWLASVVSFLILAVPVLGEMFRLPLATLAQVDLGIAVFFALEFFTRSGFRQEKWNYAKWRGFDFLAMVPALFIEQYYDLFEWFLWLIMLARLIRLVDRTLGDGFVKRNVLAIVEGIEEEISDRVLIKIMGRIETELAQAKFGETAAKAIAENKKSILERIYAEQMPEGGAVSKIAHMVGLQGAVEKLEERTFDAIIKVVGSAETDELIRDIVTQSMQRARTEIAQKSWKAKVGLWAPATTQGAGSAP